MNCEKREEIMANKDVKIFDIMACNVYWDFESSIMPKETHKFLVSLYPTPGAVTPDLIESLTAYGPGGYDVKFKNKKYENMGKNGWFYDPMTQGYWYMVNLPSGFMKEGEYTIEVKTKDGNVDRKSRIQKNAPSDAIVSAYLKHRERIYRSFSPSMTKPLPAGAALKGITCQWETLKDVANLDAFYVYRLCQASTPMEFDGNNLTWFDNIYLQRLMGKGETSGLNRREVVVGKELKGKTTYGYFVEITDANISGQANICIFQPHQFFETP
jgi:hypothetical protein